jgi:anoctamin-10
VTLPSFFFVAHRCTDEHPFKFGDSVALYFEFLACYTRSLIIPSAFGLLAHVFLLPYSWTYSILLCLWATGFVEWWRVYERILSVRWGTRGSFRVEKRRAAYREEAQSIKWWHRDLRIAASAPVILGFGLLVSIIVTALFVFEAFITQIYTGPGAKFIVGLL